MGKYTEGKWEASMITGNIIVKKAEYHQQICSLEIGPQAEFGPIKMLPEAEANAHLISAAPTGYELAEAVLNQHKDGLDRADYILKKAIKFLALANGEK